MPDLSIGLMTLGDVDAIHRIEESCFSVPWSREAFVKEATENRCARYIVLKEDGEAVAYAGVWFILDEGHITNIAVRKDRRGLGYGRRVVEALIQLAADSGMSFLTLECRRSNVVAQSLYHSVGFVDVGYRKRYYADNNEDALVMVLQSLPEGHPDDDPLLIRDPD